MARVHMCGTACVVEGMGSAPYCPKCRVFVLYPGMTMTSMSASPVRIERGEHSETRHVGIVPLHGPLRRGPLCAGGNRRPRATGGGVRVLVANVLDWCFRTLCRVTGHACGCWVYNGRWPLRNLAYWAVDNGTNWEKVS